MQYRSVAHGDGTEPATVAVATDRASALRARSEVIACDIQPTPDGWLLSSSSSGAVSGSRVAGLEELLGDCTAWQVLCRGLVEDVVGLVNER